MSEGVRVQKIIADAGLASRRGAEDLIRRGDVTINGKTAKLGDKASVGVDHIKVGGKLLHPPAERVVYAVYKPKDIISNHKGEEKTVRGKMVGTVFEFVKTEERLFPIGRLDKDAEGMLLLTNDGELARRLCLGKYETPKVYKVKIDGHLDEKRVKRLMGYFKIEDKKLRILDLKPLKVLDGKQWIRIKLTNTNNRIVRKMFEAVGRPVDKVRRMSYAGISITGMERGDFRKLSKDELQELYDFVGLELKVAPPKTPGRKKRN